jgi:hypothetical protein
MVYPILTATSIYGNIDNRNKNGEETTMAD